jgi:hypothetical protein
VTIAIRLRTAIVGICCFVPATGTEGSTMKTIDIATLPELKTKVGIHGSTRQQEVGGVFCAGVIIVINSN